VGRFLRLSQAGRADAHHEENPLKPIAILEAESAGEYRLTLKFSDGTRQTVDFGPFLKRQHHPALREWLKPERFGEYRLEYGDLIWGDYELCFPIADLYENAIDRNPRNILAV
jgi:hypothetical protein